MYGHYGLKIWENYVPSATLDIFGAFFFNKTHVYNLYLPTTLEIILFFKKLFALLKNLSRLPFI